MDALLSGVINGLGAVGIIAFIVAAVWAVSDWLDERKPPRR